MKKVIITLEKITPVHRKLCTETFIKKAIKGHQRLTVLADRLNELDRGNTHLGRTVPVHSRNKRKSLLEKALDDLHQNAVELELKRKEIKKLKRLLVQAEKRLDEIISQTEEYCFNNSDEWIDELNPDWWFGLGLSSELRQLGLLITPGHGAVSVGTELMLEFKHKAVEAELLCYDEIVPDGEANRLALAVGRLEAIETFIQLLEKEVRRRQSEA